MARKERVRPFCQALFKLQGVLLLLNLRSGFIVGQQTYIINTTSAEIAMEGRPSVITGTIKKKFFHGPNDGIWNYSVAEFNITNGSMANEIFHKENKISILGTNALSVIVQGNFTVGTDLDVNGQEVNFTSNDKQLFWLGGFVRMNKTCCTLGAGPGGAFSYHGGGHGGRGGGFYQDRNTTRLYGWTYFDTEYLLGGSTGTNLFTSKSGSGGGAIELIANDGTLTLNAAIKADGYSSGNTSDDHCAGGSSGGLIRLQGDTVVIGKNGSLSAVGGDSGFSSNHSYRCGGGGGGGVIQVFSLTDIKNYTANSSTRTSGGRGLQGGEAGRERVALYFDSPRDLKINTTSCKMTWDGNYKYDGAIEGPWTFKEKINEVCKIEFSSSIFIGRQVSVRISGKRALSLISTHGSIEINSLIDINGSNHPYESLAGTRIGGYAKASPDREHAGPAGPNCSSDELYGRDFKSLLGGSVCPSPGNHNKAFRAVGGGALELRAESGAIVIDATISANGFSNNTDEAGAMGGTIRLHANKILLRKYALLTARGSGAGGGVVQLRSDADVDGLCESKFNVTGKTFGLVNILVSTKATYQVQYIQEGYLEIDTTNARWMHKLATMNGCMAYSYYGEIETRQLENRHTQYNVTKFEFKTPILINGSAKVKVFGLHSLLVKSEEGIYIGVDINLKESKATLGQRVGGYCVTIKEQKDGKGPGHGQPGKNAGAGHGGKGGLLFEDDTTIYSKTYGIQPDVLLIGGSTGTTQDSDLVIGCGGGAIEISSEKNLTIDAVISANGETVTFESKASMGGSSGGTIILRSTKHVILGDNARLEATGANAHAKNGSKSIRRGGGGGGVIAIFSKGPPLGTERLSANESTAGGNGSTDGDNGLVVINNEKLYGYPAEVIEVSESYEGCVNGSNISNSQNETMKAHEASPSKCIEVCRGRKFHWAYIRGKTCKCSNSNLTSSEPKKACNKRCWSNSSLVCGGDGDDTFSAYKTGYLVEFSSAKLSTGTSEVFTPSSVVNATSPSKIVVVTASSNIVSAASSTISAASSNISAASSTISAASSTISAASSTISAASSTISAASSTISAASSNISAASSTISAASSTISAASSTISAASSIISGTTTPTEEPTKATDDAKTTEETKPTNKPTTRPQDEPSEKFKDIANVTITDENVVEVVNQLENLTSEGDMNGGDTKVALEILQKITSNNSLLPKDKPGRKKMGQSILQVASSLLSKKNAGNWGVPTEKENNTDKATSQTQVLEVIEHIGLLIGEKLDDNASLIVESAHIAMGVETKIPDESSPGAEYPRYDELRSEWRGQDRVFVHRELFDKMAADKSSRTTVVYAIYNQVSEHFPANTINGESSESLIVNSRILALKFNKQLTTPLKTPIKLWFDKLEKGKNVTRPSCSFVDFKSARGSWSRKGCHVVKEKDKDVECACDHLTNFAILMQVKEFEIEPDHYKALTVITYVGCGVSLFGLALTLATFLSLETLASERTSIHKNLVVAIGLAQIIFLAGIDATYNPIACKAVALFLHYLYTAAFTWMLCEGIHLYSKVVEVFSEGSKMKYYYALGWGLPLTIVFISACSRWGGYGNERACWISITDGLIWAFVAPVLIVMTINFVVMIMVIRVIIASVTSLQNPGNASQVRAGIKGMIVLLPLLGLTWVFGLLAINKDTIAFQYLFAILNSLQGLFIFAFHCIGNTEVRVAYKRLHEKRTLAKSLPEHSLSSTHHMSSRPSKKRMDSHETNFTGDDDIIVTKSIRSVSDVKICGDNMALQTFGDTDSGRWSLNCPSPDPFIDLDHIKRA